MSEGAAGHVPIAIVGAGFAGLGLAIKLREAGIHDFTILERAHELGGTWRDNTYPGCACDVASNLYSYSFAPNPDWSRAFSRQEEILGYLRAVAQEHARAGLTPTRSCCNPLDARERRAVPSPARGR